MNTDEYEELMRVAEIPNESFGPILDRHYQVEVVKHDEIVEVIRDIACLSGARKVASEYRKQGARCNIIEGPIYDLDGKEIVFTPPPSVDIATGLISFAPCAMTPNRIKVKRAEQTQRRELKASAKVTERHIPDPEHLPGTQMHEAYLRTVAKRGFKVIERRRVIFEGLESEVRAFLRSLASMKGIKVVANG